MQFVQGCTSIIDGSFLVKHTVLFINKILKLNGLKAFINKKYLK